MQCADGATKPFIRFRVVRLPPIELELFTSLFYAPFRSASRACACSARHLWPLPFASVCPINLRKHTARSGLAARNNHLYGMQSEKRHKTRIEHKIENGNGDDGGGGGGEMKTCTTKITSRTQWFD